jgi:hypothetical protein
MAAGFIIGALAACSGAGFTTSQFDPNRVTSGAAQIVPAGVHGKGLLYVGNIDGEPGQGNVLVYSSSLHSGNQTPKQTISSGTQRPDGMWVDSAGTLYVANMANGAPSYVDVFHPGASSPFLTIKAGLFLAQAVTVATDGTVYVNNRGQNDAFVSVYAPNSAHVLRTIRLHVKAYQVDAEQMAFDPQGNLFVAVGALEPTGEKLHVVEIPAGSSQAQPYLTLKNGGPGLAIDAAGNMYLGVSTGVLVFPPGSKTASRTIAGAGGLISVRPNGALYALGGSGIVEFGPGGSNPVNTFALPFGATSFGVAVSPN